MTALMKYLTIAESEDVATALEREGDHLVGRLVSIIERLQVEVDNRAWLRPLRDPDDPDTFLLASSRLYPPDDSPENVDPAVTFSHPDERLRSAVPGRREFFSASISVSSTSDEIARIILEPRTQAYPTEEDSDPEDEADYMRQSVSIRACFEDGCPTIRASITSGQTPRHVIAGFTAELRRTEIKLHCNGTTNNIEAKPATKWPAKTKGPE